MVVPPRFFNCEACSVLFKELSFNSDIAEIRILADSASICEESVLMWRINPSVT